MSDLQCIQDYPKMGIPSKIKVFDASCLVLYNFDRFVGHASRGVPDVPKYGHCHGVTKGPDERSEM